MHFRFLKHVLAVGLLVVLVEAAPAWGQLESSRKTKNVVTPTYPDLARRMRISGVVRVEVTVAPNGVVKNAKLIGGNPVLANAAMDAVKQMRYETRPEQTTETVEFHFNPQ
jgi:TonB family protein